MDNRIFINYKSTSNASPVLYYYSLLRWFKGPTYFSPKMIESEKTLAKAVLTKHLI